MKRVMKLSVLGSKTFFGQVFTCNFSIVCGQDQTPRCSLPVLGCSLAGGRWRGCCCYCLGRGLSSSFRILLLELLGFCFRVKTPPSPGDASKFLNVLYVGLFTRPTRLFYWPKAPSCLHACTVKHINSDSRPKSRIWETRLGRKRLMFNAQRTWKTRFSLQILNKLCFSFGNTSIPRSILLERRFGLGLKRASVLIPGGESRLSNQCTKAFFQGTSLFCSRFTTLSLHLGSGGSGGSRGKAAVLSSGRFHVETINSWQRILRFHFLAAAESILAVFCTNVPFLAASFTTQSTFKWKESLQTEAAVWRGLVAPIYVLTHIFALCVA